MYRSVVEPLLEEVNIIGRFFICMCWYCNYLKKIDSLFSFSDRFSNLSFTCGIMFDSVGDVGVQLHSVCLRADWLGEDLHHGG